MGFGERLKELRKANHLTQEQLADQVCTTKNNISRYEREYCAPNYDMLRSLAITLNTTVDYLVGMPSASISTQANASPAFEKLLATTADFSDKETAKLLEYAVMLKKMRE